MELILNRSSVALVQAWTFGEAALQGWTSRDAFLVAVREGAPDVAALLAWQPGQSVSFGALLQLADWLEVPLVRVLSVWAAGESQGAG